MTWHEFMTCRETKQKITREDTSWPPTSKLKSHCSTKERHHNLPRVISCTAQRTSRVQVKEPFQATTNSKARARTPPHKRWKGVKLKKNKRKRVKIGASTDIFQPTTPRMINDHPPTLRQEPQSADTGNHSKYPPHSAIPRVSSNRAEPAESATQDQEPDTSPRQHYLQNAPHLERNRQPCKSIGEPKTSHEKEGQPQRTISRIRLQRDTFNVLPILTIGSHAKHEVEGVYRETWAA